MCQNFHQNPSYSRLKNFDAFEISLFSIKIEKEEKEGKNRVWSLMKFVLKQTLHQNFSAHQTDFRCLMGV